MFDESSSFLFTGNISGITFLDLSTEFDKTDKNKTNKQKWKWKREGKKRGKYCLAAMVLLIACLLKIKIKMFPSFLHQQLKVCPRCSPGLCPGMFVLYAAFLSGTIYRASLSLPVLFLPVTLSWEGLLHNSDSVNLYALCNSVSMMSSSELSSCR